MLTKIRGFTIVEIAIVITVIGILSTVTVVAWNGVQTRASDAKIRSAADNLKDALEIYTFQNGRRPRGGAGSTQVLTAGDCTNGANGWFAKSTYTCTPDEVLVAAGLIPSDLMSTLPPNKFSGNTPTRVFMLYSCNTTKIILMWYLQRPSAQDTSDYNSAIAQCTSPADYRTLYGMQDAALIDL